jgi:hypothetical protein
MNESGRKSGVEYEAVTAPVRVQRSRAKGWEVPPNTVYVGRPTAWGNPFVVNPAMTPGHRCGHDRWFVPTAEDAVECFRLMLNSPGPYADGVRAEIPELRGKNLACWCPLDQPCHADVLLELANKE